MLSIVTWVWRKYRYEDAEVLRESLEEHLSVPYRFHVVTNTGKEPDAVSIRDVERAAGGRGPSVGCLRRLPILSEGVRVLFGNRLMQIDLDVCILANIDHLIGDSPFRIYKCPSVGVHGFAYGPGLMLMDTGVMDDLWRRVKRGAVSAMRSARDAGWTGTDQAIIGHAIHPHADVWTEKDGVYSYRDHIKGKTVPENACMIQFYGKDKVLCEKPSSIWV